MSHLRRSFAWLITVDVSTNLVCGGFAVPAPQKNTSCTHTPAVERACSNLPWIDALQGKPFVAERVSSSTQSTKKSEPNSKVVARDAAGRIHEEFQIWQVGPSLAPGTVGGISALGGIPSSQRESGLLGTESNAIASINGHGELQISILDCFGGRKVQLTPSNKTAVIQESCGEVPRFQPNGRPYSYKLTRTLFDDPRPNVLVEDLGWKPFPMGRARGVKITWLGTESDGDSNRKPTKAWEEWMSDELGVTVVWVYSDFEKQLENRFTLQNLRRKEPDASLFFVPPEYKVTNGN